jgi:hypothetical protein
MTEDRPIPPPVVLVEAAPMLRFLLLLYSVIFFLTEGSFCKILAYNLSRYCICSPYYCYLCALNILDTRIEASVLSSQNRGVTSLFLLFHGGVGLARVIGHTRAPAKSRKLGVYDSGRVCYLSCARGSCIYSPGGGIRRGVRGILCVGIWCVITSISLLLAAVLRLGAISPDPFGDPTYGGLRDPVRGLHGD